jgi:signal transduction histidine kinase
MQTTVSSLLKREFLPLELHQWYFLFGLGVMVVEAGLLAILLKFMARRRRRDEQALRELSGRLINAQEEERHRIARELHDDISQQLAVVAIELQSVESAAPELPLWEMQGRLQALWKKIDTISQDVQHISHRLHSSKLEYLGLAEALRGLGNDYKQQRGVTLDVRFRAVPARLDKGISLALFRVAQEALHNCEKHSKARNLRLELFSDRHDVVLRISDDGVGFNVEAVASKCLGIVSMEERLRLAGGTLVIRSRIGLGTQIEARVPLGIRAMGNAA